MEEYSVINILTAMITPAVLILACGSLSLTTSQRLSRSINRTRSISNEFKEINQGKKSISELEKQMLYGQLLKAIKRTLLLQKVMTMLYTALIFFITSSLLIGIFEIISWVRNWLLIVIPLAGTFSLLVASVLLIMETRVALSAVDEEMKFTLSTGTIKDLKEE